MKVYEYRCTACKDSIVTQHYLEGDTTDWGHTFEGDPEFIVHAPCGPLKRVWSAGIVWPMSERGH